MLGRFYDRHPRHNMNKASPAFRELWGKQARGPVNTHPIQQEGGYGNHTNIALLGPSPPILVVSFLFFLTIKVRHACLYNNRNKTWKL